MNDICCIGHITLDKIVTPKQTTYLPGGTSYYFSHGMRHLKDTKNYRLITALAPSEYKAVEEMREKGIQVKVLPISDKYMDYAQKVQDTLYNAGIRSEIDSRAEKIGYKIREAQMQKIPYMLVVGAKEEEAGVVSVRSRFAGDEGQKDLTAFMDALKEEIDTKTIREVEKED